MTLSVFYCLFAPRGEVPRPAESDAPSHRRHSQPGFTDAAIHADTAEKDKKFQPVAGRRARAEMDVLN